MHTDLNKRHELGDVCIDKRITLKWVGFIWLRQNTNRRHHSGDRRTDEG